MRGAASASGRLQVMARVRIREGTDGRLWVRDPVGTVVAHPVLGDRWLVALDPPASGRAVTYIALRSCDLVVLPEGDAGVAQGA